MLFTYSPEGATPRSWSFEPDRLMSSEAEAIEKVTGMTYSEFGAHLLRGSVRARRALLWVLLKRTEPTLRHSQVDFPAGSVTLEQETHELMAIRDRLMEDTSLSDEARVDALNTLDEMIGESEGEAPKAPSNSGGSSA